MFEHVARLHEWTKQMFSSPQPYGYAWSLTVPTSNNHYFKCKWLLKDSTPVCLLAHSVCLCILQLFIPWWPNPKPWPDGAVWTFASRPHQSHTGQRREDLTLFTQSSIIIACWHFFWNIITTLKEIKVNGKLICPTLVFYGVFQFLYPCLPIRRG